MQNSTNLPQDSKWLIENIIKQNEVNITLQKLLIPHDSTNIDINNISTGLALTSYIRIFTPCSSYEQILENLDQISEQNLQWIINWHLHNLDQIKQSCPELIQTAYAEAQSINMAGNIDFSSMLAMITNLDNPNFVQQMNNHIHKFEEYFESLISALRVVLNQEDNQNKHQMLKEIFKNQLDHFINGTACKSIFIPNLNQDKYFNNVLKKTQNFLKSFFSIEGCVINALNLPQEASSMFPPQLNINYKKIYQDSIASAKVKLKEKLTPSQIETLNDYLDKLISKAEIISKAEDVKILKSFKIDIAVKQNIPIEEKPFVSLTQVPNNNNENTSISSSTGPADNNENPLASLFTDPSNNDENPSKNSNDIKDFDNFHLFLNQRISKRPNNNPIKKMMVLAGVCILAYLAVKNKSFVINCATSIFNKTTSINGRGK